eukprot:GEMP01046038.1.p2 GENE.GEMP01046038.1~~GEMP01046038.1.p2  ORF type:complete len:123 (+),score=20.49 GEMP01046038.1:56-370(+)
MQSIGTAIRTAHGIFTIPQNSTHGFLNVVKLGTFARTVVWPCLVPLAFYQYIRQTDEDMWTTELLHARSKSPDLAAFYDKSKPGIQGHWRIQNDMEIIRAAANP